ncbi:hypothetical protein [Pseudarthrobacter sp. PS3-L1]|uniref:hypothetical protein n=1 Tax=Pseudarthrobacter sp. PS3-L1 TaxID=3046207 RepID=UPI0024B8E111|nr:hypothetical protein [Pseudarthrobacter sp. PS3-L1]MDJ0321414.1 hypothetical protein [Pseudarthrobacter sp. PS3-L1]
MSAAVGMAFAAGGAATAGALVLAVFTLGSPAAPATASAGAPGAALVLEQESHTESTQLPTGGQGSAFGPETPVDGSGPEGDSPGGVEAVVLTAADLQELQLDGWACPGLRGLGYTVTEASAHMQAGAPAVKLRLAAGAHEVTVVEQHAAGGNIGGPEAPFPGDGFIEVPLDATTDEPTTDERGGSLWVREGTPWEAVYRTDDATYTYSSTAQPAEAEDEIRHLMTEDRAAGRGIAVGSGPSSAEVPETFSTRVQRGFLRMTSLFTQ